MPAHRHLLIAAALIVAVGIARADDRSSTPRENRVSAEKPQFVALQKSKATDKKAGGKKPRKFRGRLPQYYGQIGLSAKQRKDIYAIQISYRERLQKLEQQLRDLRAKQSSEIEAVLTSEQKKKHSDLLEAARKKRKARSNKRGKKARGRTTDKKAA
jgi:hypothetical protein